MWYSPTPVSTLSRSQIRRDKLSAVAGLWSIIVALIIAIVFIIVVHWQRWRNVVESVNIGTMGSLLPIFNTASEVGYGNVIASLPAFLVVKRCGAGVFHPIRWFRKRLRSAPWPVSLVRLRRHEHRPQHPGRPLFGLANAVGISPELLHRVAVMSSGSFDSLPHNGAVITLLSICRLTHRQSYFDIFMVSVAIPVSALVVVITLGTMFGSLSLACRPRPRAAVPIK